MPACRRRVLLLLFYTAILIPPAGYGAYRVLGTNANSPLDWVPSTFPARAAWDGFRETFGSGDVVFMSWPGCTIDEPALDDLTTCLRRARAFHDSELQPYFERVISGREEFRRLVSPACDLSVSEAVRRLNGSLLGPDERTTMLVVAFHPRGLTERGRLIPLLRRAVTLHCQVVANDIRLAGPVIDGHSVDVAGQHAMQVLAPLSGAVVFLLCRICLKSTAAALLVFGVSLLCQAFTMSLIYWCGDTMTALLIVMPPLIQVLAVAGGIHLVNYYHDGSAQCDATSAAAHAFRMGWLPCTLSSATTAIGLASLMVSGLTPVRAFGMYAAIGVVITLAALLCFIPGVLLLRPLWFSADTVPGRSSNWENPVAVIARWHGPITVAALLGMLVMAFGLTRLHASVRIETLFGRHSRIMQDYRWLESHTASLVPVDVMMRFGGECPLALPDRLKLIATVEESLRTVPGVGAVLSAQDFLPGPVAAFPITVDSNATTGTVPEAMRSVLEAANYLETSDGSQDWRLTAFVSAVDDIDYGTLLGEVEHRVDTALQSSGRQQSALTVTVTGIMPLVHGIQHQLLRDLFVSFVTAFGVILLVMTVVQAGFAAGMVAMIPNVFPTVLVFGAFGWLELSLDIGSVMTASVALGIAVDDTLHFLTYYRRMIDAGRDRRQSVLEACRHCGRAMIHTTLICGPGMLMFALADFVPTARFAWMMLTLLAIALIGDLVVLPALLLGPAGRFFEEPAAEVRAGEAIRCH